MEPRKIVGREREGDRLHRLEQLNRFVQNLIRANPKPRVSTKDESRPVRKIVGRSQPR